MKLKISQKILVPVLVLVVMGTVIVAALSYSYGSQGLRRSAESIQQLVVGNIAEVLTLWMRARTQEIQGIAVGDQAAKAVGEGFVALGARKSLGDRLSRTLQTVPAYAALAVVKSDNTVVASAGDDKLLARFATSVTWSRLEGGEGYRQDGEDSSEQGPLSVLMAPIDFDGKLGGAVVALIRLNDFGGSYLDASRLTSGGRVVVVAKSGRVLLDTRGPVTTPTQIEDLGFPDDLLSSPQGTVVLDLGAGPNMVSHLSVDASDFAVVVAEAESEVLASARSAGQVSILTAVAVAFVTGVILMLIVARLVRPISETASVLESLAAGGGDLSTRLRVDTQDEVGILSGSFNRFIGLLHDMVKQVRHSTNDVVQAAHELDDAVVSAQRVVDAQMEQSTLVATAVNQLAATSQDVAQNAQLAADATSRASEQVGEGRSVVGRTISSIQNLARDVEASSEGIARLSSAMQNIGSVVDVINNVAEQTNLLALNAAIEAARAGEMGRGFAVVADEVRTLAQRTQSSVDEIKKIIDELQTEARSVVSSFENSRHRSRETVEESALANQSFEVISHSIDAINNMIQQIAAAAEEQSAVTEDISVKVTQIHHLSESTASQSRTHVLAIGTLRQASEQLSGVVSKFKV